MLFGEMVRISRKQRGYTQQQLADMVSVSKMTIRRIESAKTDIEIGSIKYMTIAKISMALNDEKILTLFEDVLRDLRADGIPDPSRQAHVLTDEELRKARLDNAFDALNETGQTIAVERVEELTEIPRYQRQQDNGEQKPD